MAKKMTDEERKEMIKKMDEDLDEFIKQRVKAKKERDEQNPQMQETPEEILERMENHPAFMQDIDWSKPLSPAMEALMALKYEDVDNATDKAENFKEDGNQNFKNKKYRWAIDSYTEGIKCRCPDKLMNAILYTNRAAAHYHIGNYRTSFTDCMFARKFKTDHMKALVRGIQCCLEMKKPEDALKWADQGLMLEPENEKILDMRNKAEQLKKSMERDRRKDQLKEKRKEEQEEKLLAAIQNRGIKLAGLSSSGSPTKSKSLLLSSLESQHPGGAKVFLDNQEVLHWPVMFLYPEYQQSDFIETFSENHSVFDHLVHMFSEPVPWDQQNRYRPGNIEVYFEDKEQEKLYKVNPEESLATILGNKRLLVYGGTPTFILLSKDAPFTEDYLKKYKH